MTDFGHAEEDERNVSRTRGTKDFLPSKGMLACFIGHWDYRDGLQLGC
jgi:hypothetical protein